MREYKYSYFYTAMALGQVALNIQPSAAFIRNS